MIRVKLDKSGFDSNIDPISVSGLLRFAVKTEDQFEDMLNGEQAFDRMVFTAPGAELTIASGAISAPTLAIHTVGAESGTTDDLDTIGASNNAFVVLKAAAGDTITIRPGIGNITTPLNATIVLTGNRAAMFFCQGGQWSSVGADAPTLAAGGFDPGSGDDVADGYKVGAFWLNTVHNRIWRCVDATAGNAIWKWVNNPKNGYSVQAAAAALVDVGCVRSGSFVIESNQNDSNNVFVMTTDAASHSYNMQADSLLRPTYDFVAECIIKTYSHVNDQRIWLGFNYGGFDGSLDTQTTSFGFIGFRFSTSASDAGFRPVLHDGTTQNTGAAIGTVATNTVYKLRIRVYTQTLTPTAYFSVNDSPEVALSTNFPATSSPMYMIYYGIRISGAVKFLFNKFEVAW